MIGNRMIGAKQTPATRAAKSPMEDFLFILVISLAVAISFFANKQMADHFALVEKVSDVHSIPVAEYSQLPVFEMPDEPTFVFGGQTYDSLDSFQQFVDQNGFDNPEQTILMRIERSRSVGDMEDAKHVFLSRGITVLTEWENRK